MKFVKMNNYFLKEIFYFINNKRKLKIIKYSKKVMSKMDITNFHIKKYSLIQ